MQSLIAWLVLPALLLAVSAGLGHLVSRLTGAELPAGLRAPVGAAAAIALALAGYVVGLRGVLTPLALAVLAAGGFVLALRGGWRPRRPGALAGVWAATYALYLAPVVLSGHWTWAGYNFVNDTSVQLLLAEWLPEHGREMPPGPQVSTTYDVLRTYFSTGYPVGSHALLAASGGLVPIPLEALYQPFIATFAGLSAMALTVLARPLAGLRWAAFGAVLAMASNLLYQYALQGNMKELVTVFTLSTAAAVSGWSVSALRAAEPARRRGLLIRSAVLLALPVAAAVNALSTAGGPYAALIVLGWLALVLGHRVVPGPVALGAALAAGGVVLLALTAATLETLVSFGQATQTTYASPQMASELGHLVEPLEVLQTAGIWLAADYRFDPAGAKGALTTIGIWLALVLAVVGAVWAVLRRRFAVLVFALPLVVLMLAVTPRVSPYADAKTYMLLAPGVTLLAALGAAAVAQRSALAGVALAAVLAAGVVASDALAYYGVQLAPAERMEALHDLDERYERDEGMILVNEPEEFAKNFLSNTRVNVGAEAITPYQTQLRVPQAFAYRYFDLDDIALEWLQQFPLIALRRSPVTSRPPSNYRLDYANRYYEVWRREPGPRVLEHMPLQDVFRREREPSCGEVILMAGRALPGETIVASAPVASERLDTADAARPPSWRPHPFRADMVITGGPGTARADVGVATPGRYRAWIAGSFGRPITGAVDGRAIGTAQGVNTVGQWHEIGTVELERGRHELTLTRPGGGLGPGNGFAGDLGPMVLERVEPRRIRRVEPVEAARLLCGREWDWIERVDPRG